MQQEDYLYQRDQFIQHSTKNNEIAFYDNGQMLRSQIIFYCIIHRAPCLRQKQFCTAASKRFRTRLFAMCNATCASNICAQNPFDKTSQVTVTEHIMGKPRY